MEKISHPKLHLGAFLCRPRYDVVKWRFEVALAAPSYRTEEQVILDASTGFEWKAMESFERCIRPVEIQSRV